MKKGLEPPAPSDIDLFQQAVEGVTPITPPNRVSATPARKPRTSGKPATSSPEISDSWSDHGAGDVAPTSYLRDGLNRMTLRKLRRGLWPVQESIDLHGYTSDEARHALMHFLQHALLYNYRCVSVIHGKGWRAEGGEGVLKIRVRHWLSQYPPVLAFCEAPANAGGGGAVWILLKHSS
jgi:DNA-nicking Smr family endonuclease